MSTQNTTVITRPFSGDYRIDVLLDNVAFRWNTYNSLGTVVEVPYSFLTTPSTWASADDKQGFNPFTPAEIEATRSILAEISKVIGINFVEVDESKIVSGIRFANNRQEKSAGYAIMPQPAANGTDFIQGSGDVYMASNQFSDPSFARGSYEYMTLVHEIGHALGLNHPGNYNAGEPPSAEIGNYLASSEDSTWVSIMSYNSVPQAQNRTFFGTYDMLALKYLYGSRNFNHEDTTYTFTEDFGRSLNIINDTGGVDTLNFSSLSGGVVVSLEPGAQSSIGTLSDGSSKAINNLSIAFDALIENIVGTNFDDVLTGNSANNVFNAGAGNNQIDGGAGNDTSMYSGARATYSIQKKVNQSFFVEKPNAQGGDTLTNVETLKFSDMTLNLGVGALAKSIDAKALQSLVELYIAYFNRVPDADGMSYWIQQYKSGVSLEEVGRSFYAAAVLPQFTALTKYSDSMSNIDFIKIVYKNVLGRDEVDQAGLDYWSNSLSNGSQTRGSLIGTILGAAHSFKGRADYGYVADLLDNKFEVGKYFAIDNGVNYLTPEESYAKGVLIAAAITPNSTEQALKLIGIHDQGFNLST